jgi:hypothetical protein
MKATELIILLQEKVVEHGDFEVLIESRLDDNSVSGIGQFNPQGRFQRWHENMDGITCVPVIIGPTMTLEPNLGP